MINRRIIIWVILGSTLAVPLLVLLDNKHNTQPMTDQHLDTKYKKRPMKDQHLDNKYKTQPLNDQHLDTKYKTRPMKDQHLDNKYKLRPVTDQHLNNKYKTQPMTDQHLGNKYKTQPLTGQLLDNKYKRQRMADQHLDNKYKTQPLTDQLLDNTYKRQPMTDQHLDNKYKRQPMSDQHLDNKYKTQPLTDQLLDNTYKRQPMTDQHLDTKYKTRPMKDQHLDNKYKLRQVTDQHLNNKYKTQPMTDQHLGNKYKTQPLTWQLLDNKYKRQRMADQHLDNKYKTQPLTDQLLDNTYKRQPMTDQHLDNKYKRQPMSDNQFVPGAGTLKPEETVGKVITRDKVGWTILGNETCKRQPWFILSRILPFSVPIFVYPAEKDIYISHNIINSGSWEGKLVNRMVLEMKLYPDAVFIDIGANIGVYSLTMAALGYRVIAVDCNVENVKRICASSIYSNNTKKISIIHNGLSNKRVKLKQIKSTTPNVGGMGVEQITSHTSSVKNMSSVQAILLDDLLEIFPIKRAVLKMDVEKHEDKVLEGASKFFKNVQVECVLLEFRFHRPKKSGQFIIDFFDKYGLKPLLPSGVKKSDYRTWPEDLIWSRERRSMMK